MSPSAARFLLRPAKAGRKGSQLLQQFDPDVAWLLNNRIPVDVLSHIALSGKLPQHLQTRNILIAAWSRAALLDNFDNRPRPGRRSR